MNPTNTLGRHKLSTRFTSIVRICSINYPDDDQLQMIYGTYLKPILQQQLPGHRIWSSNGQINQLAVSMIQVYNEVCLHAHKQEHVLSENSNDYSHSSYAHDLVKINIVIICLPLVI